MLKGLIGVLVGCMSCVCMAQTTHYAHTPLPINKPVKAFIKQLAKQDHLNQQKLTQLMAQAQYIPEVIKRITSPYEAKAWYQYRNFFLSPSRIQQGVEYWRKHAAILKKITRHFGVAPSVIVAIIGVESRYGRTKGHFQELGALATLAFHYPSRAKFFTRELSHLIMLSKKMHLDPLTLNGSYAGALGIPQFMPSSYLYYAVDFTKAGRIDLLHDNANAMASIANYLKKSGWVLGQPVAIRATLKHPVAKRYFSTTGRPKLRLSTLRKAGVNIKQNRYNHLRACLIRFQNKNKNIYWITFRNFRAIMQYNPRVSYAMAVYQLSQAIRKSYQHDLKRTHHMKRANKVKHINPAKPLYPDILDNEVFASLDIHLIFKTHWV